MKRILKNAVLATAVVGLSALAPACSCGDDDDNGGSPDASGVDAPGIDADVNAFPSLGTQIDRAGRPGVSTALIASFLTGDGIDPNDVKREYNQNDDPATWVADYTAEIASQLGVIDSIDSIQGDSGCGNQLAYVAANNYTTLAGILADDRLLINTTLDVCNDYLAVESESAVDCGGRTPVMDVIDVTYGVLVNGGGPIPDGAVVSAGANDADFPFLEASPN